MEFTISGSINGRACAAGSVILVHMKTTLNLDDRLMDEARRLTGVEDKDALVHRALKDLVARENAHLLSSFAGPSPELRATPRRRFRIRP